MTRLCSGLPQASGARVLLATASVLLVAAAFTQISRPDDTPRMNDGARGRAASAMDADHRQRATRSGAVPESGSGRPAPVAADLAPGGEDLPSLAHQLLRFEEGLGEQGSIPESLLHHGARRREIAGQVKSDPTLVFRLLRKAQTFDPPNQQLMLDARLALIETLDLDLNGHLDEADMLQIIEAYGTTQSPPFDLDHNGRVDEFDLQIWIRTVNVLSNT